MAKKLYTCRAETAVLSTELEYSRAIGVGQIIDLEEKVGEIKGRPVKLRELVRADCFSELAGAELSAAAASIEVDDKLEELEPEDTEAKPKKTTRGK